MIEISIKIEQKANGEGIAIGFVPKMEKFTDTENVYASIIYKLLIDVISPTIHEFTSSVGGESAMLKGDKAIFLADQMGWLPPAPENPEDN